MNKKYKILGITFVLILYVSLLFVGAVIKVPSEVSKINNIDKLVHFIEYFVLALVLFKSLELYKSLYKLKKVNIYILGLIIGIVFMILSEVIQTFVPNRTFSYIDLLADFAGFIIGVGVFKWMFFKQ